MVIIGILKETSLNNLDMNNRVYFIYKYTFPNGKVYIGQTCRTNPNYRWNNGKGYIVRNPDSHFARAILKCGGIEAWNTSWTHEIIEDNILTLKLANKRESFWINYFDSVKNGYNANYGGDNKLPSEET